MRTLHCLISLLLHFWTFELNGEPITSTNGMCVVVNIMSNSIATRTFNHMPIGVIHSQCPIQVTGKCMHV